MPPPTLPTDLPSGSTSIFAPTSRGVEPWRETMVARTGAFHTTKEVFGNCLHRYLIKDAIADENVLGFLVEYSGRHLQ